MESQRSNVREKTGKKWLVDYKWRGVNDANEYVKKVSSSGGRP